MKTQTYQNAQDWRGTVTISPRRMVQAYRQAPWRIATQRGVLFLIVAILAASTLWVMVSVTVQASTAGLEIQQLQGERESLDREIAGLRTKYAAQTSAAQMEKRAIDNGFEPVKPENIVYLVVPGYTGREPEIHAPPPSSSYQPPLIKPIYTQSLWEWMLQGILEVSEQQGGAAIP